MDSLIARLADRQHGVVGHGQLVALGLSGPGIHRRIRAGRLHPVYRGVYAVGHSRIGRRGWWMAATLAAGEGAVLSHHSAAALWGLRRPRERIHVTVPTRAGRRRRKGLTIHRTSWLPEVDVTTSENIPVTSLPRTLIDIAEMIDRRALERTLDEAEYLRLYNDRRVAAAMAAHSGRVGARRLAKTIAEHVVGSTRTNEGLEEDFLLLCRANGIPDPVVHARVGPYEVDFLWPEQRVIVETDDASHRRTSTYESDRDRDAYLDDAGYRVRRFTSRKIRNEPAEVVRLLLAALSGR